MLLNVFVVIGIIFKLYKSYFFSSLQKIHNLKKSDNPEEKQIIIPLLYNMSSNILLWMV